MLICDPITFFEVLRKFRSALAQQIFTFRAYTYLCAASELTCNF